VGGKNGWAMANWGTGKSRIEVAAPMKRDKAGLYVQLKGRALNESGEVSPVR
jgi:hypothetical protein